MVNFEEMLDESSTAAPVEPRELYAQLNKRPGYGKLWDVQAQVLTGWHSRRKDRDLVVKVNTGGGKTIDGLVILQSYLNAGEGPALYVAPDKYLVKQVIREAENLGIATTRDVDSSAYLSGEAIGVVNVFALINGRTKFSRERAGGRRGAPIGAVVIDDAHAALATTQSQLSIRVSWATGLYSELLSLFRDDLLEQNPEGVLDLEDRRSGPVIQVPFWAWDDKLDKVRRMLHSAAVEDSPWYFAWPSISSVLQYCRTVFSSQEVSITPYVPPIGRVTSFVEAQHRVFLTATLADDSILVTHFGVSPESARCPVTPVAASDIGERMILAPSAMNPDLSADAVRERIAEESSKYNTVVIVPSRAWYEKAWGDMADVVADAENIEDVVECLRAKHVGLVVLVNRYDGVDLPGDACRILVLDGLPESFSPEERLASAQAADASGVDYRQVQRVEQGMGRAVRSNEDHCMVFLLGANLAQLTIDPHYSSMFSLATRAQLDLSRRVAMRVEPAGNPSLDQIFETAEQALNRDPGWVKLSLRELAAIKPSPGYVSRSAEAERLAFDEACHGSALEAGKLIGDAADGVQVPRERGRLLELRARYVNALDPTLAQQVLSEAIRLNGHVTRPLAGVAYTKMADLNGQASAAAERYRLEFGSGAALRLGFKRVLDDLTFDGLRTDQFEEAVWKLGQLLGLGSQRPEFEQGIGPDNLWALGGGDYWVIEDKSGATSAAIGKRDLGQLLHSIEWFRSMYPDDANAVPVMVHPSIFVYKDAVPPMGLRVITKDDLAELRKHVNDYSRALAESGWDDPERVERLLSGHQLLAEDLGRYASAQRGKK